MPCTVPFPSYQACTTVNSLPYRAAEDITPGLRSRPGAGSLPTHSSMGWCSRECLPLQVYKAEVSVSKFRLSQLCIFNKKQGLLVLQLA